MNLRGKCRELSEAAVAADPSLTLVRGWYFCPIWNRDEEHWWTVRADGAIFDPTCSQFPSNGVGIYTEFDGTYPCMNCGKDTPEAELYLGATCSGQCYGRMVGVPI